MSKERADLGFGDALESFDPDSWNAGKNSAANDRPKKNQTAKAAEAAGFKSREVKPTGQGGQQRRRRTGRNAQLNLKAKPDTIEEYCAIADQQGWGLGETLEKAVELLKREYS